MIETAWQWTLGKQNRCCWVDLQSPGCPIRLSLGYLRAKCDNVLSQDANIMQAATYWQALPTNCWTKEIPLEDSVFLLYKYTCTAEGCLISLPIFHIIGGVVRGHQVRLQGYPESPSSNPPCWPEISWI